MSNIIFLNQHQFEYFQKTIKTP